MTLPPGFLDAPFAHRGLHGPGRPENGMAAFRAAIEHGYGIELDVQPSADGVAMVFHDPTLDRMTEAAGLIDAVSANDLGRLTLRGGDGGVPRLTEVLAEVAGRVPLLIEVKDRDGAMSPDIGPLETSVLAALEGYGGPVAVMSFNPHSVARLRDGAPHLPRGIVTSSYHEEDWSHLPAATRERLRGIPDYAALGCCFVSHQADALDMPRIAELREAGAAVLCWTIRSPEEERRARAIADAVTFEGYLP